MASSMSTLSIVLNARPPSRFANFFIAVMVFLSKRTGMGCFKMCSLVFISHPQLLRQFSLFLYFPILQTQTPHHQESWPQPFLFLVFSPDAQLDTNSLIWIHLSEMCFCMIQAHNRKRTSLFFFFSFLILILDRQIFF